MSVIVRHKCSDSEDKAYAMLDTYSEVTLAKENLLSDLGIEGKGTSITST